MMKKKPAPPLTKERAKEIAESRQLGLEDWTLLTGFAEGKAIGVYCVRPDGVLRPYCQYRSTSYAAMRMYALPSLPGSRVRRSGLIFPCEPPELLGFLLSLQDEVTVPSAFQQRVIELSPNQARDAYCRWTFRHPKGLKRSRGDDAKYRETWLEATEETLISLRDRLSEAESVVPTDAGRSLNDKLSIVADLRRQIDEAERSRAAGNAAPRPLRALYRPLEVGVVTSVIVSAFSDLLKGKGSEWFEKALGEPRKHGELAECRIGAVKPRVPARWDPVAVADWLVRKGLLSAREAGIRMQEHLPEWLPGWERIRELDG